MSYHEHKQPHDHKQSHSDDEPSCCGGSVSAPAVKLPSDYRFSFRVEGLDCTEEVGILRKEVGPLLGDEGALSFDVINGRMFVTGGDEAITEDHVIKSVARTGMAATLWQDGANNDDQPQGLRNPKNLMTTLSGLSILTGVIFHISTEGPFQSFLDLFQGHGTAGMPTFEITAYALAMVLGARYVAVKAWYALRRKRADMNLLMVVAVTGAAIIGEWFEGAMVTFLFSLSLAIESWSVGRARKAIEALLDLTPSTVFVKNKDGNVEQIPASDVNVGSIFVVRPGDKVPLDGVINTGITAIDQAPITGESVPVSRAPGDDIYAGTINQDGLIEVKSTKAASDTTLSRIIRMVEEAHSRRANVEQWVEKFSQVYTPAVIVLALLVFTIPPLFFEGLWADWLYRALVLLVIACPCALVISTPVSIVAALASSARQGVLVKGGAYMEQPARLKVLAFDKTGTITQGFPEVVKILPFGKHTESEVMAHAVALENMSTHPLARAILGHGVTLGIENLAATDVKMLPGKGVVGTINDQLFWLGSHRLLVEKNQATDEIEQACLDAEKNGNSVIVIGNDEHVCGMIAVADKVRPGAAQFIQSLKNHGIEKTVMLSGDNQTTAMAIAAQVGIDDVRAELLPEDKVTAIKELGQQYGTIAMIGDGVNDAPAMAEADLAIAMGAMGSDTAIEVADIALMTDDLPKISWLIGHSRRTLGIIRENIGFALGVKIIFVGLTFLGYASLWGAIAADAGASLLVVANGLRLLKSKA